ncbi:MAG: hypothetical protein ABJA64_02635 [Candidatus Saccharibacteria bacterium]
MSKQNDKIIAEIDKIKPIQLQGRLKEAKQRYNDIFNFFLGDHGAEVSLYIEGTIVHQLASIHGIDKNAQAARDHFQAAQKKLRKDPMALGRVLRDHGNFELLEGNSEAAERLIHEAMDQLKRPEAGKRVSAQKLKVERLVTKGFLARVDLAKGRRVDAALAELRALDMVLDEYGKKPEYTLANLGWIIDFIQDDYDRAGYIARAIQLSDELGNVKKRREYQMLQRGGDPLRNTYRFATTVTAFGTSILKATVKKLT